MLKNLWYKNSINFCPNTQWQREEEEFWELGIFSGGLCCVCVCLARRLAVSKTIINYCTTFSPLISMGIISLVLVKVLPKGNKLLARPRTGAWLVGLQLTKLVATYILHGER